MIPDGTVETVTLWATSHGLALTEGTVRAILEEAVAEGGVQVTPEPSGPDGLTERIISNADLQHLDGMGGAYFALELREILAEAIDDGWRLFPPDRGGN